MQITQNCSQPGHAPSVDGPTPAHLTNFQLTVRRKMSKSKGCARIERPPSGKCCRNERQMVWGFFGGVAQKLRVVVKYSQTSWLRVSHRFALFTISQSERNFQWKLAKEKSPRSTYKTKSQRAEGRGRANVCLACSSDKFNFPLERQNDDVDEDEVEEEDPLP